jgi:hypothetical protein
MCFGVEILGKDRARVRFMRAMEFLGGLSTKQNQSLARHWASRSCEDVVAKSSSTTSDMM